MNRVQRQLRAKWIVAALVLGLILAFNGYLEENAGWLRWFVLLGVIFFAMAGDGRSRAEMREEASFRFSELVESAPWLKVWLSVWAAIFFIGAIYVTRNSIDLFSIVGSFRFLLFSFAVLVGPVVVLAQYRQFKALGEAGDEI